MTEHGCHHIAGVVGFGGLFGTRSDWSRRLATATIAGVFLGVIGPFGSYLDPALDVVGYWVGSLLCGAVVFGVTLPPALRLARKHERSSAVVVAMVTVVTAIPLSLAYHVAAMSLWPGPIGRIGALVWYGQTLVISAPFTTLLWWSHPPPTVAPLPVTTGGSLLARLPAPLGREIVALQIEDHYVRVHTRIGSTLVLLPLRQAIEGCGLPGLRSHRSWWVARDAVTGVRQDGRNVRLVLSNGLEAPVSRANLAAARQAGLLGTSAGP